MIAKEEFLKKYNISKDLFWSAEMPWVQPFLSVAGERVQP